MKFVECFLFYYYYFVLTLYEREWNMRVSGRKRVRKRCTEMFQNSSEYNHQTKKQNGKLWRRLDHICYNIRAWLSGGRICLLCACVWR